MNAIHPVMATALAPFMPKKRPTDREMLQVLADGLGVTPIKAHEWIYDIDFDGLSDALIDEARAERGFTVLKQGELT